MSIPVYSAHGHEEENGSGKDISSTARLSIGQVLEQLRDDFPSLTVSKLRFLEDQGLVSPHRSPSGYRKFSDVDVERLRFILTCQRDRFWPLKVIKEHLEEIDSQQLVPTGPRVVADAPKRRLTEQELAEAAGVDLVSVADVDTLGLIKKGPSQRYDATAVPVVRAVTHLMALGIDTRHLRAFRATADREAGLIEQVVAPLRSSRSSENKGNAQARAEELSKACIQLHAALLDTAVSQAGNK